MKRLVSNQLASPSSQLSSSSPSYIFSPLGQSIIPSQTWSLDMICPLEHVYSSVFVAGIMIDVFNVVVFVVSGVGRCVVDDSGVTVFAVIVVAVGVNIVNIIVAIVIIVVVAVVVVFVSVCAIGDFPNVAVFACPVLAFVIFDDVVIIFVVFVVVVVVSKAGAIFDVPIVVANPLVKCEATPPRNKW